MKHRKHKRSESLFKTIAGKFSYKQRSLLTGAALFAVAGVLSYLNTQAPVLLAAPELGIAGSSFIINLLIGIMLFAAFILVSKAINNKNKK